MIRGTIQKNLTHPMLAVILMSLMISGPGPGRFSRSKITGSSVSTPAPISSTTIKVISYNVLFGAGVDRKYDDLLPVDLRNKNRLPEFLSIIDGVKPDILGIQEANGWDRGDPPIVEQVAEHLDMNYYLANAPNDFHVVLLTKFEIIAVENLSGEEGDVIFETMRALRATLLTPDKQFLNIFVVHLDPLSTRIRLYQVEALINQLEPYREQTTLLLGDMNFCVGWPEYTMLEQAGWQHVAVATDIDQIWISPAANWTSQSLHPPGNIAMDLRGLSDHLPVGSEISIYPDSVGTPTSTTYSLADRYSPGPDC
jgi:endonuclease/exonuclease/phosphatase family metal-dependent hydrolase